VFIFFHEDDKAAPYLCFVLCELALVNELSFLLVSICDNVLGSIMEMIDHRFKDPILRHGGRGGISASSGTGTKPVVAEQRKSPLLVKTYTLLSVHHRTLSMSIYDHNSGNCKTRICEYSIQQTESGI